MSYQFSLRFIICVFIIVANELQDVTAYGLRSDFLSPETMPQATVELALTKNRKLLLACMLAPAFSFIVMFLFLIFELRLSLSF
jgi:hypothetical protein